MLSKKQFNFGGLNIELYVHPEFGSVTTMQEFADIVGVAKRSVERHLVNHGLIDEKMAQEDEQFSREILIATNLSRLKKSRNFSKVLLPVKGMIFLTMLLKTERALAFKHEVLETIEKVESKGHTDWASLESRLIQQGEKIEELLVVVVELREENRELRAQNNELKSKIDAIEATNYSMWKAGKYESSAAGYMMNAAKARKKQQDIKVH